MPLRMKASEQEGRLNIEQKRVVAVLKNCVKNKDLEQGAAVHDDILKKGLLGTDLFLASTLVTMYVKCGALAKAREVLEVLPVRNVVTWSVLIAGYARENGHAEEALNCFDQMIHDGLCPDAITFASILKACGSMGALEKGKQVHAEIARQGLLRENVVLGNALVHMYVKCGALSTAREVLEGLRLRDVVTWSTLIAGYAQEVTVCEEALKCFEWMQNEGHSPDAVTFACALKACGSLGALDKGKQIHADVVRLGLETQQTVLGNALVDMYVKCGAFATARDVLECLPSRSVITWNALIAGYAQEEVLGEEALHCFKLMQDEGHFPDEITFICILKACGSVKALEKGKHIHAEVVRQGLLREKSLLGNVLVDMYGKCGASATAQGVFEGLLVRDVVTWNALIAGYAQEEGHCQKAFNCFQCMRYEGISSDIVTFVCILRACSSAGALANGKVIHDEVAELGLLKHSVMLGNALVDMYAKCGALTAARQVLYNLPVRDIVSWNTLIAGYAQEQTHCEDALSCFECMQREGHSPDAVTFVCILKACGSIGALDKGKQIHLELDKQGLLGEKAVLGSSLVDMYAKCGAFSKAREVLGSLSVRNVVTWNALIAGYSEHGHSEEALNCFEQMQCDGFSPHAVTLGCVLSACSHLGLVDQGEMYFHKMNLLYGIQPNLEHHRCMVDLFGRAGHFDKAVVLIKKLPPSESNVAWATLLGACRKWGCVNLGQWAFEHIT